MNEIKDISEVSCPNSTCKGHFTEDDNNYSCSACDLKIRIAVGEYKLTPQDLFDMLHGTNIGPIPNDESSKETRWTEFHEFTSKNGKSYQAALAFKPKSNWSIARKFPEGKSKKSEPTGQKCPRCMEEGQNGVLMIRHGPKDKFLGCSNFPKCKYTESYAPFLYDGVAGAVKEESKEAVKKPERPEEELDANEADEVEDPNTQLSEGEEGEEEYL